LLRIRGVKQKEGTQFCALAISVKLPTVCVVVRAGKRGVRVSDFFLQKLRFSALCGPN